MSVRMRLLMASLTLVVVSCGMPADEAGPDATTTTGPAMTTSTAAATASTTTRETTVLDQAKLTEAAISDLSRRLLTTEDNIEVIEAKLVQWPDGSLGCPEEGVAYTQAIVDGAQVLLRSDGRVYDYHAGSDGVVFLCPSDEKDGGYDFVPPPGFND
ncbi:MAG: hypothetical protein WCE80_02055 [Acidimicrobiia bacterium]